MSERSMVVTGLIAGAFLLVGVGAATAIYIAIDPEPPVMTVAAAGDKEWRPAPWDDDFEELTFDDGSTFREIEDRDPDDPPPVPSRSGEEEQQRRLLLEEYDLDDLQIHKGELHSGGPSKDGIPALTDPPRTRVTRVNDLPDDARVIQVVINGEAVAYPLNILNYHEIINDTVGGVPIAVVFCPLCDSASVFDRRLTSDDDGETKITTLEFGVSGLLVNSNVVMYDRTDLALWSQLQMKALSGPRAGTRLNALPLVVTTRAEFARAHPTGMTIAIDDTGYVRDYAGSPYQRFLETDSLLFPVPKMGDALPRKTLGMGVLAGDRAIFVPRDAVGANGTRIDTDLGPVTIHATPAGMTAATLPDGVGVVQTFYYAWSAYHPNTEIAGGGD